MKKDQNKMEFIGKWWLSAALALLLIFLGIWNALIPYPLLFKEFLYISDTDLGNSLLLYKFRMLHEATPVSYDLLNAHFNIKYPDSPIESVKEDMLRMDLSIPYGYLTSTHSLFDLKGRGNNDFLTLLLQYKSGSLYRSPAGIGWSLNYDKKIYIYQNRYYVFHSDSLQQIFVEKDQTLKPLLPQQSTLEKRNGLLHYQGRGSLLEIYSPQSGRFYNLTRVEDRFNNFLEFNYTDGKLTAAKESAGRQINFEYNADGFIIQMDIPGVNTFFLSYDAIGNLVKIDNTKGTLFQYKYNSSAHSHILTDIVYEDTSVKLSYDSLARVKSITCGQDKTKIDYSRSSVDITKNNSLYAKILTPEKRNLIFSGPDFPQYSINFDERGNLTYSKNSSREMQYILDAFGNLIEKKTADGQRITYSYEESPLGRLCEKRIDNETVFQAVYGPLYDSFTLPSGNSYRRSYDEFGNVKSIDKNGKNFADLTYDEYGNILKCSFTDGSRMLFEYGDDHRLISFLDRFSNQYKISSHRGKITEVTAPDGGKIKKQSRSYSPSEQGEDEIDDIFINDTEYAQIDFLKEKIDLNKPDSLPLEIHMNKVRQLKDISIGSDYQLSFQYSKEGHMDLFKDSTGNGAFFKRNDDALLRKIVFSKNIPISIKRNKDGFIKSIEEGGKKTLFYYDSKNRIESHIENNVAVKFSYESSDRISSIVYPDRTHTEYVYDTRGYLSSVSYEGKNIADLKYEPEKKSLDLHWNNGIIEKLQFDSSGRLSKQLISNKSVSVFDLFYSRSNDKIQFIEKNGPRLTYSYDDKGRVIRLTLPDGLYADYEYDEKNHVQAFSFNTSKKRFLHKLFKDRQTVLVSDSDKNISLSSLRLFGKILGDGIDFIEADNSPAKIKGDTFIIDKYSLDLKNHTPETIDNISTFKKDLSLKTYTKSGEKASRLIQINLLPEHSTVVRFLPDDHIDYYAADGKMTHFAWDDLSRLRSLETAGEEPMLFDYNLNGTLHSIKHKSTLHVFVYDIYNNLIAITDTLGNTRFKIIYDYSRRIPLGFLDGSGKFYSVHQNHNSSVFAVFDNTGELINEYTYGPFGNTLLKKEKVPSPILFRGLYLIDTYPFYIDNSMIFSPSLFLTLKPSSFLPGQSKEDYLPSLREKHLFPLTSNLPEVKLNTVQIDLYDQNGRLKELSLSSEFSWINLIPGKEKDPLYFLYNMLP